VLTPRQAEKQLILQYRRSGSRRDRDAVIERFQPLARNLARRYRRGAEPLEDLEQVASLALLRAVEDFDPARDVAFSSYRDYGWSVRVPRELQELAQSGEEDGSASLIDTMGGHDNGFRGAFDRVLLESLLEALDEREQAIVRLYHLEELTQSEIGRRLGLSQRHISRLLRQATDKLAATAAEQSDLSLPIAA
jgi:RNA polymerase sigma-B factor